MLHRVVDGRVVASFGEAPVLQPGERRRQPYKLGRSTGRSFWSAAADRYQVELWTVEGQLQRRLVGERDWFDPPPHDAPPTTTLMNVWESDGLLWVLFHVRDPQAPGFDPRENMDPFVSTDRAMDTVIEVIDPTDGSLVAAYRTEMQLNAPLMTTPGLVESRTQDDTGFVRLRIWELVLERPAGD